MRQAFEFNLERWPLIVLTVEDDLSSEAIDGLLREYEAVFARKERFAALTDARRVRRIPNAAQRARIGAWSRTMEPVERIFSVGHATVLTSPLARGAMTAISWLHQARAPQAYFATILGACDWCIDQLRTAGVPLTPALEAYRALLAEDSL